jgi:hypothetical protein
MYEEDVKPDKKDLLIICEDLLVKILTYLQHWRSNQAAKSSVVFLLQVLCSILKDGETSEEEL